MVKGSSVLSELFPGADPTHAGDFEELDKQWPPMETWSCETVAEFLTHEGFGLLREKFKKHKVDGSMLSKLAPEDFATIGVKRVGVRKKLEALIHHEAAKEIRSIGGHLRVPNRLEAMLQVFTFAWAQTSEGKDGDDYREELSTANFSIALVGSIMTAVLYEWFNSCSRKCLCYNPQGTLEFGDIMSANSQCMCMQGYDLTGLSNDLFMMFSGFSAAAFLCSTMLAVLQILMLYEMSDSIELCAFSDMMGNLEVLPTQLLAFGILMMQLAAFTYMINNQKNGLERCEPTYVLAFFTFVLLMYVFLGAVTSMIQSVYKAKVTTAQTAKHEELEKMKNRREMRLQNLRSRKSGSEDGSSSYSGTPLNTPR